MSVITFDFAESRRSREEYLIALAAAVQETITGEIAAGTRGQLVGCGVIGAANSEAPITVPTLAEALGMEKVPAQKLSARAQKLATIPREADPVVFGGMTPADLLDCEAECQCQEGGTRYSSYRFAVGAVHAKPGEAINPDLYLDPARHYCAVEWARRYLAEVNTAFDVNDHRLKPVASGYG